jgi:Methylase involved in ubiquinone/menaquinone biosynthesis
MKKPFEEHTLQYDLWFDTKGREIYLYEGWALCKFLPKGRGIEVGVGTGRFAEIFNLKFGVDPSINSLRISKNRVKNLVCGYAEDLPFKNESFDFALVVVSICFFDDVFRAFSEINRILKKGGRVVVGFVPKDTCTGEFYSYKGLKGHRFYKYARFFTEGEIEIIANSEGFRKVKTAYLFAGKGGAHIRENWGFRAKFAVMEFLKL